MIDHTDQLVVPVTAMEDRAEAALLTLEARGGQDAELARNACSSSRSPPMPAGTWAGTR